VYLENNKNTYNTPTIGLSLIKLGLNDDG